MQTGGAYIFSSILIKILPQKEFLVTGMILKENNILIIATASVENISRFKKWISKLEKRLPT